MPAFRGSLHQSAPGMRTCATRNPLPDFDPLARPTRIPFDTATVDQAREEFAAIFENWIS